jgi:site-specific DNA-methyltransferase (adenine-specific)
MAKNRLYYGDNLELLQNRDYFPDAFVDLVYLDPPFKSSQDYNVLFKERNGTRSAAQVKAFKDTWWWDTEASRAYTKMVEHGPEHVSNALRAFRTFLGTNDMLAYLSMMAPRLVELRRVLKPTGSIYLHCDPTASHYLKMLMDAVFGPERFRNEVVWKRTPFAGSSKARARQLPRSHDLILFYSKSLS